MIRKRILEIYWVLRSFYADIMLYAMPDVYDAHCVPITIASIMTPVIAVCSHRNSSM